MSGNMNEQLFYQFMLLIIHHLLSTEQKHCVEAPDVGVVHGCVLSRFRHV